MVQMMQGESVGKIRLLDAMDKGWGSTPRKERATGTNTLQAVSGRRDYFTASNDQVQRIAEDAQAWEAGRKVDRSGRIGRADKEETHGWTSLMLTDGSATGEEGWKRRDHFRKLAEAKGDWEGDAFSRKDKRKRILEAMDLKKGDAFKFSTSGGKWGSLIDEDGRPYVLQSKAEFDAMAAGYSFDEKITASLGRNRWVDQGGDSRRAGSLGAEFLQGIGHLGALTRDSTFEERRAVSRELIAGVYDLQGDATAERAALLEATRGRGQRSLTLMDQLLQKNTPALERARQVADLTGMDTTQALEKVKEIDAAAEEADGRETQVKKAIELLGGQLDQTLVTATEKQIGAAESMSSAADKLVIAADNLNTAAGIMSGGKPDTTSYELPVNPGGSTMDDAVTSRSFRY
jgi:hypothetical protein